MHKYKERIKTLQKQNDILRKEKEAFENNEKMLHTLVETAVGDIGQDFFNNIVIKLSEWLNAECVIIGQIFEGDKVEALPMYLEGKIIQGYSYNLKGTPCDLSTKKGYCTYEENITSLFPEDKDLVDIKAEGYVGIALYNKKGEPNGVLCAMSQQKLKLPSQAKDMLRIVGARVTAEIERIKAQKKLEISETKLRESNASKDRFFSIIAHDLKSPFNSLIGFSELTLKNISSKNFDKIEEYVQIIHDISYQTHNLLQNLLEWSQTQAGSITFSPEHFNLADLFNNVIEFQNHLVLKKNITISHTLESDLNVFADKNMMATIVRNLMSNALKYTQNGGKVAISAITDYDKVKISVSDTGIGIKPEDVEKLFGIENNINTPGTNNEKGTGLGLIICKEYVKKHNGKIWVESEFGKGSIFNFTIINDKSWNCSDINQQVQHIKAIEGKVVNLQE